jgi:hypothetical protein
MVSTQCLPEFTERRLVTGLGCLPQLEELLRKSSDLLAKSKETIGELESVIAQSRELLAASSRAAERHA